jgi:glycosyltransferase involved in cell wall biosynthesis
MTAHMPLSAVPRLLIVGALGAGEKMTPAHALTLARLFREHGYRVATASEQPRPLMRLLDTVARVIWHGGRVDVALIDVYGGRSFVIEDIASLILRVYGTPTIMTLHGGAMPEFTRAHLRWVRRVLGRAAFITAPSSFLPAALAPFGLPPVHVVANTIDIAGYPFRHREQAAPRLVWMRSFHPVYNPLMAVRVLARVRAAWPDAVLVMAGHDKGLRAETEALAAALGVRDAVRFTGYIDMAGKVREFSAADIYLNTNTIDNMPVSVVEAGAFGLPIVATNVGGIPHLLQHEQTGLLVPDDDDAAMAEAVLRILRDPALCARLSRSGRVLAESFGWDAVRTRWEGVFADVLRRKRRTPTRSHTA